MSCGFGAIVLLFLIIKHSEVTASTDGPLWMDQLVQQRKTEAEALKSELHTVTSALATERQSDAQLKQELASLLVTIAQLKSENEHKAQSVSGSRQALNASLARRDMDQAADTIRMEGDGERRYLTGLKVTGRRIVLMMDRSASMADEKIVDIIRRRSIGGDALKKSPKWLRTRDILAWLSNRLPDTSSVQVLSFSDEARIHGDGWIDAADVPRVADAVNKALATYPKNGTNLAHAFSKVASMKPLPDSVYLITDGLPTQGSGRVQKGNVTGDQRASYFEDALRVNLPSRMQISTILLPLEGDPLAAFYYWALAHNSGGTLLSPSKDWP
jgi:hypothetical protein